eukprot:CAMPEP_0184357604 /NCGR_PEP_ID=MMETSP1089-20130417/109767_1 /TAXON_ID=38269 ORGANISM="Gloeochaete wittrockiana, Strain SAG46.84" /NCGR_SAMPLE_ID=MMETSP1089 /ASSEMBLY_ACC=CAM_ASM_000445 /LENGTH=127 /DNA_ID=CAMNT_0026695473 /DNA_START=112 /DNA_END=495 /DNA_ORIENTATION=-
MRWSKLAVAGLSVASSSEGSNVHNDEESGVSLSSDGLLAAPIIERPLSVAGSPLVGVLFSDVVAGSPLGSTVGSPPETFAAQAVIPCVLQALLNTSNEEPTIRAARLSDWPTCGNIASAGMSLSLSI